MPRVTIEGVPLAAAAWITDGMAQTHGAALARLFSSRVVRELASMGRSPTACQILKETGVGNALNPSVSLAECFESLLKALFRNYRNEYVYKNAIANKILLGRHSLRTSFMLTEFRVGDCKADVVVLNGSSHVYEIKSKFDGLTRLGAQVSAYRKAFEYTSVITSADQLKMIRNEVDERVGLMILTDRNQFSTVREPRSCIAEIDPHVVFDSLRQSEFARIISERYGDLPDVPNTQLYKACRKLFCQVPIAEIYPAFVNILRMRGDSMSLRSFIESVPSSLKAMSLACRLSWQERGLFVDLLETSAREALLYS